MNLTRDASIVTVIADSYVWRWNEQTDEVIVEDAKRRRVATGTLQPVVLVADQAGARTSSAGDVRDVRIVGERLEVRWAGVNGSADMSFALDFEPTRFWMDPVSYSDETDRRVVSMHQFAQAGERPAPALRHTYFVQPGLSMSPGLSPVLPTALGLDLTSWLGRGSMGADSEVSQQWGLPVHYFCGINRTADNNARESLASALSDAYCCGLASIPTSDVMFDFHGQAVTPVFSLRADLWRDGHQPTELGARLVFTFGQDYREAIRAYYAAVVETGIVALPERSAAKTKLLSSSQFNTWGAQCEAERVAGRFDQQVLESIYEGMRRVNMRPSVFVIDDKWEGAYGVLTHDSARFPEFEEFLQRVRDDGQQVGLWAAFLRTNDPSTIGLETRHLMCDAAGKPIEKNNEFAREPYYLFDVSQDEVAEAITKQIATFVHRYDPDLVKFDFGYELPSLGLAMPANAEFSGEMLLKRALDVIVGALRAAKPDIAVMYYNLSPLFIDRVDQVGHDDMYLAIDSYDFENNRRVFFSSLLAELGVSVYASGGYNWRNMSDVWFDTAVIGNVGSVNGFDGDEHGETPDPVILALYNGLGAIARPAGACRVDPVSPVSVGSIAGARSRSWIRFENDALVGAALRTADSAWFASVTGFTSNVDLAAIAMDGQEMTSSKRVGVVAFGEGELRMTGRKPSRTTQHLFDGTTRDIDGDLRVGNSPDSAIPVEWLELLFD
jgi:hypothetical protein